MLGWGRVMLFRCITVRWVICAIDWTLISWTDPEKIGHQSLRVLTKLLWYWKKNTSKSIEAHKSLFKICVNYIQFFFIIKILSPLLIVSHCVMNQEELKPVLNLILNWYVTLIEPWFKHKLLLLEHVMFEVLKCFYNTSIS